MVYSVLLLLSAWLPLSTWFFWNMLSLITPVSRAIMPKLPKMMKRIRKRISSLYLRRTQTDNDNETDILVNKRDNTNLLD